MATETPTTWIERVQTQSRRLLDARPSWLFRGNSTRDADDGIEGGTRFFQTLSANLLLRAGDPCRTLLLTSPAPGDGKSTISANLAAHLTRQRTSVLLVDADLRRPVLHRIFQLPNELGFSDVLNGVVEPEKAILETSQGLHILPSGPTPEEPTSLLGSDRIRDLLTHLSQTFGMILFDAPPVFSAADPTLLAPVVDWTLLVLSAGTTTVEEAKRAKEMVEAARGRVLGSVLNNLDARFAPDYYRYTNYYTQST